MIRWVVYAMVYLGSILMVHNIVCFALFARRIISMKSWKRSNSILYIPVVLLICFLIGYLAVAIFGKPDIIIAGILFGGSIFVFIMYNLLNRIVQQLVESEQLEAELLAAEKASHAKSSFLASISHEMRTPMNVILGMDELALKNRDLPGQTREMLEKIGASARQLSRLIDGMLDLQEIENGTLKVQETAFSLKEVLREVSFEAEEACKKKGLAYQAVFAECAGKDYTGDSSHIRQVLFCLLDNAVKFTDAPGTVELAVSCSTAQGACTAVHFSVSDTGIGIDEAFLPKILEPFTQEDVSFSSRYSGSGMGLALAGSIVKRMGGTIDVKSKKGEGSTFTVTLPLPGSAEQTIAPDGETDQAVKEEEEGSKLEGKHVLIVEDTAENAEILLDLLDLEGAESDWAENGMEAVNKVSESSEGYYDAVLMDLRMPVMDGMEATRKIRALDRKDTQTVPILAVSANNSESDVKNSLQAGMNEHLSKPVDADQLYSSLDSWIRKRKEGDMHD